jgi:hypothetical protein
MPASTVQSAMLTRSPITNCLPSSWLFRASRLGARNFISFSASAGFGGNPSGDLALNYQARTITQIDGDKEEAFQLMRKHIALNSASSYSSVQQMVQMITDEVRAMEQNGTDQTLISQMPLVVEAIELAEKLLKWTPDNVMMLSTIGNLVMLENQTKVAMDYLKRSKGKKTLVWFFLFK